MVTQEVSLVDKGANGWRFLITKSEGDSMDAAVQKLAMKMPTEAKKTIMDGLSAGLDQITALAGMVGNAETDDAASVPSELGMALVEVGKEISSLGAPYAGAAPADAPPEQPDTPEQTPPPGPEEAKAAAPAAAPATAPAMADPLTKSLPTPQTDSLSLSNTVTDLNMGTPKIAAAVENCLKAISEEMNKALIASTLGGDAVNKAGRKISANRYKKLETMYGEMGKLLNELAYDEAMPEPAPGKAPAAKSAPQGGAFALLQKMHEGTVAKAAVATSGASNQAAVNGGAGGAPVKAVQWPLDMSAAAVAAAKANRKRA